MQEFTGGKERGGGGVCGEGVGMGGRWLLSL